MDEERNESGEFDFESIRAFLLQLRKNWLWIFLSVLIFAVLAYSISAFVLQKKYTSDISLYVNNQSAVTESANVDLNNINASQKLVDTYMVILQDDDVLEQVAKALSVPMTEKALAASISMNAVNETEVLRIAATTTDPKLSAEICEKMAAVAPDVLERVVKAGSVEVIGSAKPAKAPSSPHVEKNTVLGALLGFLLSVGILFLVFITDNTIRTEEDLKAHLDVPVLGEIPSFDAVQTRGKKHGKK